MKSNEEFLKGIYEKADYVREREKIQPIRKKYGVDRVVRYAAGIAACFLCGVVMIKGMTGRNPQEGVPKVGNRSGEPMTASMDAKTQLLDCKISEVVLSDGMATIEAVIVSDKKPEQKATISMITETKQSWMEPGTEVLFSVYESEKDNAYTQAPDVEVFIYQETKDEKKYFESASGIKKFLDDTTSE